MRILQCPQCKEVKAVENESAGVWCDCHNPAVFLSAEKDQIGTLSARQVKRAIKYAKHDAEISLSKLLKDLLSDDERRSS
jgi:hypothetical protein